MRTVLNGQDRLECEGAKAYPDPLRFYPNKVKGRHPLAYIPLILCRDEANRNCIGQNFAMNEICNCHCQHCQQVLSFHKGLQSRGSPRYDAESKE